MKTDIQIAQETTLRGVNELATEMGLSPQLCEPFGSYIAKVSLDSIDEQRQKDHHLILVTAISPTRSLFRAKGWSMRWRLCAGVANGAY